MTQSSPFESEAPASMSPLAKLFWITLFFGSAGSLGYRGEPLLGGVLGIAGLGALSGYRFGAFSMFTSVASFGAAAWFGPKVGIEHEAQLTQWIGTTGLLNRGLSIAIAAILVSMLVWLISYLTVGRAIAHRPHWYRFNQRAGFILGCFQGVAAASILIGGLLLIEPKQRQQLASQGISDEEAPTIAKAVFWVGDQVDQSVVGPAFREHNPIEKIPQLGQLDQLRRTASVLSDPHQISRVIEHPSIRRLQREPAVQQAVAELRNDENVQRILRSGNPMNREAAMTLLSHPAFVDLVDQPGFLEQAKQAISDVAL